MIAASYRGGVVIWDGEPIVLAEAPEAERVMRLFAKPATVRSTGSGDDGLVGEDFVRIAPGSAEHARGVIVALRDVRLLLDDSP